MKKAAANPPPPPPRELQINDDEAGRKACASRLYANIETCSSTGFFNGGCFWSSTHHKCMHKSEVDRATYLDERWRNPWYRSDEGLDRERAEARMDEFEAMYAQLDFSDIECIPRVCESELRYLNESAWPDVRENQAKQVFLPSLPGSGNTWTRSVIQQGTRLWTGAVYFDPSIFRQGYKGERVKNPTYQVSAVKTHWPALQSRGMLQMPTDVGEPLAAIHILRSPIDAFVSEFNRIKGGGHTATAPPEVFEEQFPGWIGKRAARSTEMIRRWTAGNFTAALRPGRGFNGISEREITERSDAATKTTVLTVYYEDLVRDFVRTVAQVFWFLRRYLGAAMPPVRDAVVCALHAARKHQVFHRSHGASKFNPYTDLDGGELARRFCAQWADEWSIEKWGQCTGAFQDLSDMKPHPKLPEETCPY